MVAIYRAPIGEQGPCIVPGCGHSMGMKNMIETTEATLTAEAAELFHRDPTAVAAMADLSERIIFHASCSAADRLMRSAREDMALAGHLEEQAQMPGWSRSGICKKARARLDLARSAWLRYAADQSSGQFPHPKAGAVATAAAAYLAAVKEWCHTASFKSIPVQP